MSRSKKKTPKGPLCCIGRGTMKKVKIKANRRIRRAKDEESPYKVLKKLENRWAWPDDGKIDLRWDARPDYKAFGK